MVAFTFMKIVEQYAWKENVWIDEFKAKFCQTSRADELGWSTVFSRMPGKNTFKNPMQQEADRDTTG